MTLPDCLTRFDIKDFVYNVSRPKQYCEAIVSRPRHCAEVAPGVIGVWAHVPAVRCVIAREMVASMLRNGFFVSVLTEFDDTDAPILG